jgi:hypothetical protein
MLVSARQRLRRQWGERGVSTQALDRIWIGDETLRSQALLDLTQQWRRGGRTDN